MALSVEKAITLPQERRCLLAWWWELSAEVHRHDDM